MVSSAPATVPGLAYLREQLVKSQPDEPALEKESQASDQQADSVLCPTCGQVMQKQKYHSHL